jgi:hypothetical protein
MGNKRHKTRTNKTKFHNKENCRGNQELTIQRHWQHGKQKTADEDKQNKCHNKENCRGNQELTIQRHWQQGKQKTADEDKQNK